MKILVVDDDKFNLMIAKDSLEDQVEHSGILLCRNPLEVMGLLETEEIGVVLLDIVMPHLDGISLLKQIRSNPQYDDLQIIMFSAVADHDSFQRCFESGANDYVSKPINPPEFIARMRAAVKIRNNVKNLKATQAYLAQTEKLVSIGELAAGVAHEINNPLGFVGSNLGTITRYLQTLEQYINSCRELGRQIGDSQVAREELAARQQQVDALAQKINLEYVLSDLKPVIEESREGVVRIEKIVRSLRNFARSSLDEEVLPNSMEQILDEALQILQNEIKYVATVEKDCQPAELVACDKGQLVQVLVNVLHNAAQAIKAQAKDHLGTIRIEIYSEEASTICRITDNGPGIKPEHLRRVFDPFFTTKDVGSGTGLGLSIAYGIVKKYGGEMLVDSEWGAGARFTIKLPAVRPAS